ncbi:MAG: DMT family transporter [Alphaproteobacteria bacterium]|nr:DMT family transporter [Alphaproteobacteria bacterium]
MNQLLIKNGASPALIGAAYMVFAGVLFALVNISVQGAAMHYGLPSSSVAFLQYAIALIFGATWLARLGWKSFATENMALHILRVLAAAAGVQLWVLGLKYVPIWQAIALIMTSPFFVTLGASLFLRESVSLQRWLATLIGFAGGMIILAPWSDSFTVAALYPLAAAALWAFASLLTKRLTKTEAPDTVTAYLLVLLTPINAVFASFEGFVVPTGTALWLILLAGGLTALAQLALTRAYAVSDASYVQPFDHLKLPLNVLFGWLAFQFVPGGNLWIGAALIVGASMYILRQESREQKGFVGR